MWCQVEQERVGKRAHLIHLGLGRDFRRIMSSRPHCPLTVVVGDEHGLLKHIHVPSVFAPAPRKPDRLRAAPRELGEAGPRATLDPTLVLQNKAEFAAWKAQVRSSSCPSFWFCFFWLYFFWWSGFSCFSCVSCFSCFSCFSWCPSICFNSHTHTHAHTRTRTHTPMTPDHSLFCFSPLLLFPDTRRWPSSSPQPPA